MALHLIKLCVGCSSIEELESWLLEEASGGQAERIHTTRMVPKRMDELLDGGSLYWVIRGNVQCHQKLLDIRPFTDYDGVQRCQLVLEPKLIETVWQPRRAFQGWRYLKSEDAPADVSQGGLGALPIELRQELSDLGLL